MSQADTHVTTLPAIANASSDTFVFDGVPIQFARQDGVALFFAVDVCSALGLSNPSVTVQSLDEDERAKLSLGRQGWTWALTEGGLYTLILRSRGATKPGTVAHRFRKWVTSEVIPQIHRTGAYVTAQVPALDLDDNATLRRLLLARIERVDALEALVDETSKALTAAEVRLVHVAPMVDAYNAFLIDEGLCNLRTAARAIDAPCEPFFAWLRKRGWVVEENKELQPNAQMRRDGYMVLRPRGSYGGKLRESTMVTRAGLAWLRLRWRVGPGRDLAIAQSDALPQARLPGV